jgi:hypothetical protein
VKRGLLIAAGVGVLALLVGLVLAVKSSPKTSSTVAPIEEDGPVRPTTSRIKSRPTAPVESDLTSTVSAVTPQADGGPTRIVHDHTGEPSTAPRSPILAPTVILVRKTATPKVKECVLSILEGHEKIRVNTTAHVKVAGGRVTVQSAVAKIGSERSDEIQACVEKAFTSIDEAAPETQGDAEYDVFVAVTAP